MAVRSGISASADLFVRSGSPKKDLEDFLVPRSLVLYREYLSRVTVV